MKTQSKESVKFATLTLQVLEEWHVQSRLFVKLYLHSHVIFTKLSPGANDVNKEKISSVRCSEEKPGTYILWLIVSRSIARTNYNYKTLTNSWDTQQSFIWRGSFPKSKPFPLYKLFFDRKRYSPRLPSIKKMVPLSNTSIRTLHLSWLL